MNEENNNYEYSNINKLTIIIPNHSDMLMRYALDSINCPVEVIVALNNPSEQVLDLTKEYLNKKKIYNLRVVFTEKLGMPAGLNAGVSAAVNEDIVVLDSDCVLDKDALFYYKKALEHNSFVRGTAYVKNTNMIWCKETKKGVEAVNEKMKKNPMLFGPAIAFKKTDYLQ